MTGLGSFNKSRVEAFSDGVFAIVVTLLVLDLKFPAVENPTNHAIWYGILSTMPKVISWVISFLIVCVIWMNHHRLMDALSSIDGGLFWLNNLMLMFISLIPFPTIVLGDYPQYATAVCFYGVCMALVCGAIVIFRLYAQKNKHLLKPGVNIEAFRKSTTLSVIYGLALYLLGAGVSWMNTYAAFGIYFFIPVYFIFPRVSQARVKHHDHK
jgi:TMEM175 potassium channel family protein